jgi:hypothetical protein
MAQGFLNSLRELLERKATTHLCTMQIIPLLLLFAEKEDAQKSMWKALENISSTVSSSLCWVCHKP